MFVLFPCRLHCLGRVLHRLPRRFHHGPLHWQLLPSKASARTTKTTPIGQAGQPRGRKSGRRGVGGLAAAVGLFRIWKGIVRTADRCARIAATSLFWLIGWRTLWCTTAVSCCRVAELCYVSDIIGDGSLCCEGCAVDAVRKRICWYGEWRFHPPICL